MTNLSQLDFGSPSLIWERIGPSLVKEGSNERGALAAYLPTPDVCVVRGRGHLSLDLTRIVIDVLDPHIAKGHLVALYYDYEHMTSYDAEGRHLVTNWGIANRKSLRTIDILIGGSRFVAMGVAAASLAMKVIRLPMRIHSKRSEFESILLGTI